MHMNIRLILLALCLRTSRGLAGVECWGEEYTQEDCCDTQYGPRGNEACWDVVYTYRDCCEAPPPSDWDKHIPDLEQKWDDEIKSDEEVKILDADWVVIGSGSGGSIVAATLAKGAPDKKVLVLEAGALELPEGEDARWFQLNVEWGQSKFPRSFVAKAGKVVGGTSLLNGRAYTRGAAEEFAPWPAEEIRSAYAFLEEHIPHTLASPKRHELSPVYSALADAFESQGVKYDGDPHAEAVDGSAVFSGLWKSNSPVSGGPTQVSSHAGFADLPAAPAWKLAAGLPNIQTIPNAYVSRLRLDAWGVGVEFLQLLPNNTVGTTAPSELEKPQHIGGRTFVRARHEVILAAGTFGTPRVLLASGIGAEEDVRSAELVQVAKVDDVGKNLNEHLGIVVMISTGLTCPLPWRSPDSPISDLAQMMALLNVTQNVPLQKGPRDIELLFVENCIDDQYFLRVRVLLLHPLSRGRVRLRSRHPLVPPHVTLAALSHEADVETFRQAMIDLARLMEHEALRAVQAQLMISMDLLENPVAFRDWLEIGVESQQHWVGTCRLSLDHVDSTGCVDERLRVRGVPGLRVADASVLSSVSGHTDGPARMVGYRAGKMLLEDMAKGPVGMDRKVRAAIVNPVPRSGLGTAGWRGEKCTRAVLDFLQAGGRHLDTALFYANDADIRRALVASSIPRAEVFLTTKLYPQNHFGYSATMDAIRRSLRELGVDYLDLVLLHEPGGDDVPKSTECAHVDWQTCRAETWRALEQLHQDGRIRFAGVSNFGIAQLAPLLEGGSPLRVSVHQLEAHPWWQPNHILEYCRRHEVQIVAYGSLGKGSLVGWDAGPHITAPQGAPEMLHGLAMQAQVPPGQLLLRWALAHGFAVVPRSSNPQRMRENLAAAEGGLDGEVLHILDGFGAAGAEPLYGSSRYISAEVKLCADRVCKNAGDLLEQGHDL